MADRSMTIDQAKLKIAATLRTLRKLDKLTAEERKAIPSREFGDDFSAVRWCIFDNREDLRPGLPDVEFGHFSADAPPKQNYMEFLAFYEQLADMLGVQA